MALSAQRQFLVSISGIDGYFMTKSGGEVSAEATKVYEGGAKTPVIITAPADVDNITISRNYDPERDASVLSALRAKVGVETKTVTVQPTDRDLVASGKPIVYAEAVLVRIGEPEFDANSGDMATYELEFAVKTVA